MQADGALKQKLEAWVTAQQAWADAFAKRKVPSYLTYSGSGKGAKGTDFESQQFQTFMNLMMAKELGLDMQIKK